MGSSSAALGACQEVTLCMNDGMDVASCGRHEPSGTETATIVLGEFEAIVTFFPLLLCMRRNLNKLSNVFRMSVFP